MDRIICLVGKSGSGKSTISELLEKQGYNYIESYTTRKQRFKGEKGHIFINTDNVPGYFDKYLLPIKKQIIAYTYFENNHYWATKEQYKDKGTSIYIIDPAGIKVLKEKVKDAKIVVIYLKACEVCRINRMLKREGYDLFTYTPKSIYERISKRADFDKKAFNNIEYNYEVNAEESIKKVLQSILNIIKKEDQKW